MRKKILSLFCAAGLVMTLLVVPASAANSLFFLSLNDTLPENTLQNTPVQHNGWIYVPVNVFNGGAAGVNFGVYHGVIDNNTRLVLYNLSGKTMTFDLQNGTATAEGDSPPIPGKVLYRNGLYYVPAYAVCRYFGMIYSYHTTQYGPLLRIKDSNAWLSDQVFISSASSLMQSRFQEANRPVDPGGGTPPVVPEVPKDPTVPEVTEPAPSFPLYLGVSAQAETDLTPVLNALEEVGAYGVVFFPAGQVSACGNMVRQAAGRGHKVGLIPQGETGEEKVASVRAGSRQLAAILRQETWFVLGQDPALSEAGYLCWTAGVTAPAASDATTLYQAIVPENEVQGPVRVLLSGQTPSASLAGTLRQLAKDGDTFLRPKETKY